MGYAGVPPSQMETEITRKVEDAVSTIVGIEHINSNISTGISQTVIEFEFGTDLSQAMDDVRDAVSRIRPDLPHRRHRALHRRAPPPPATPVHRLRASAPTT